MNQPPSFVPERTLADLTEILQRINAAVRRLDGFVRVTDGRFGEYIRLLRRQELALVSDMVPRDLWRLIEALSETSDLTDIAQLPDATLSSSSGRQLLKKGMKGPAYQAGADESESNARDSLFELCFARHLHRLDLFAHLSETGGDVVMAHGTRRIPAECKRCRSTRQFEQLIGSARDQLQVQGSKYNFPAGLIVVDASCVANPARDAVFVQHQEEVEPAAHRMLKRFLDGRMGVIKARCTNRTSVLGLVVRLQLIAFTDRISNIHRCEVWHFVPTNAYETEPNASQFESVIKAMSPGNLVGNHQIPIAKAPERLLRPAISPHVQK